MNNEFDSDKLENCFELALENIIKHGDTDIFPYPFESRLFEDDKEKVKNALMQIFNDFENKRIEIPPNIINSFSSIGYYGYRWASQIDPFWNAFFLGLVLKIADDIERNRSNRTQVYSYRFKPNLADGSLFDKDISWRKYQEDSITECSNDEIKYVLTCDIADFYPRIYHHRLENALDRIDPNKDYAGKIKKLLQTFSETKSYGVPVGCPASRILAELALDSIDKLLSMNGINYKRYVDDFVIFCNSREDAHKVLTLLSKKLMENEGLTLQKQKTNIVTKEEFLSVTKAKLHGNDEDEESPMKAKFMSLPIRFDPYSANAIEEYEEIKESLKDFDLLAMLSSELQKSKINQSFSKHLIKAFSATSDEIISSAFKVMFNNLHELYPIFTTIIQVANSNWQKLSTETKDIILDKITALIKEDSYILSTELNLAYVARMLSKENSEKSTLILSDIYNKNPESILIKNIVTQSMAKVNSYAWLSDIKKNFSAMHPLQRRLLIVSSYILGDEGRHWREHNKKSFNFIEMIYRDWASQRHTARNLEDAL
ncbi:RNA-dependent DNA polymerase [Klebsiella quasipneumoniae]|uniref:RNA-directed DNA polymerase n=1 Tax=Klebsiella quasipneumoniae TaxID=1463165 RepID=UPI000C7CC887|nr:RNA-directed DNA polymerase [Klebsiella quasipneumoniae]PLM35680.1 RNA-dependent DNA polymerase [Klebsiella quasipneumoniae]